jgi:hypothetical protein
MKAILSLKFVLVVFFTVFYSSSLTAQDMKKPDPVKSETLDKIMGTWVADPYEMMGSKWNESATHTMELNGQFMYINISGSDDKGSTYTGLLVVKPNSDGTFTGWSFDDWGQVGTYSMSAKGNNITVNGKTDWGSETREIEINGNTMVHKLTMTMKGPDGKDMTMNQTVTYHKK